MICLNCDSEEFVPDEKEIVQIYREETFMVKTLVVVCTKCGWTTVGNDQIDELIKRTKKRYESIT